MTDYEPVRVHLASIEAGLHVGPRPAPAPGRPSRLRGAYQTWVLDASDPVACILPDDPRREIAYVQAVDNDIILAPTRGEAASAANTAAGVPQPAGSLVPKANTAPWPVADTGAVFAGATTTATPSRVTVTAYYKE